MLIAAAIKHLQPIRISEEACSSNSTSSLYLYSLIKEIFLGKDPRQCSQILIGHQTLQFFRTEQFSSDSDYRGAWLGCEF